MSDLIEFAAGFVLAWVACNGLLAWMYAPTARRLRETGLTWWEAHRTLWLVFDRDIQVWVRRRRDG